MHKPLYYVSYYSAVALSKTTRGRLATAGVLLVIAAIGVKGVMQRSARRYLGTGIDIVEQHSVRRYELDWPTLRRQTLESASDAWTAAQTHDAIRRLLARIDQHSGLVAPELMANLRQTSATRSAPPDGATLPDGIGYVIVRQFLSPDRDVMDDYATKLQGVIARIDRQQACGWIVDLRQNGGGNMWPMLAGLGPLLGEGSIGSFIGPDALQTDWSYADGAIFEGESIRARVKGSPYRVRINVPPVALLVGRGTTSSGEAVAIAFAGRPLARSFGQRTRGLTTANDLFALSDGAAINLSVSTFADRFGRVYQQGITPDELVAATPTATIPDVARNWLRRQDACR